MSLDFEVSTIATMTVPDSWRLSLEAPRYSTIAPPVGVTRMSRPVSHPLLRSIHPSPSVLSTPQSVERYRRRSASKDSSNAVNPIQLSASHFHMAQILATKKLPRVIGQNVCPFWLVFLCGSGRFSCSSCMGGELEVGQNVCPEWPVRPCGTTVE